MPDPNLPVAWRVIDTKEPRAIVATYTKLSEANALCDVLEDEHDDGEVNFNCRFICEPVRNSDRIASRSS